MSDHDELKLLLPFYVNGTLNAADCARIDQGLATSAELRNELEELNGLAQMVREGGQAMTKEQGDVEAQLGKLMDDPRMAEKAEQPIRFAEQQSAPAASGLLSFLNPKNWHPAVSLAIAAAAVAQAGWLMDMNGDQKERSQQIAQLEKKVGDLEYQLASGPDGGALTADILVQVKPGASWQALSDLLSNEALTIVNGPSDNTLSLSSELDGAALDAVIARLRASGLIETADKAA
jgi:hypothetical protein